MDIDFEKVYTIPLKAMRLNRSHPEVPQDKKWILRFLIMHGAFTLQYIGTVYNMVLAVEKSDFTDACRQGIVSVAYLVVSFQYFILVIKKDTILKIMNMMKDDFKKNQPDEEKIILMKYANKGSNVCYQWFIVIIITSAMFPIKFVTKEIYLYLMGEFELEMIYPMIYPSIIEEYKMQPIIYVMLNTLVMYYICYEAFIYTSFVPLGLSFMLHACGQLDIVKKRTLELYVHSSEEEVKVKLIEIVKQLQYIYEFVDYVEDTFMVVYEITMKGSTIILPITSYQVLQSFRHGEFSIEFIAFIVAGALISSLPCYYSDMLMEKSDDVRQAVYCCGWESIYDRDTHKTIQFILLRALRPCCIRSIFRTMSLEALTDMFEQAYALFNLMNAAWG